MAKPDYREGSWNPALVFSGGSAGITYSSPPIGVYTKIGRIVVAHFVVNLSSKGTGAGAAAITGLPYDDGAGVMHVTIDQWSRFAASLVFLGGGIVPTDTRGVGLRAIKAAATAIGNLTYADLSDNSSFNGTVVYTAKSAARRVQSRKGSRPHSR
jgi:hypothetical protein